MRFTFLPLCLVLLAGCPQPAEATPSPVVGPVEADWPDPPREVAPEPYEALSHPDDVGPVRDPETRQGPALAPVAEPSDAPANPDVDRLHGGPAP